MEGDKLFWLTLVIILISYGSVVIGEDEGSAIAQNDSPLTTDQGLEEVSIEAVEDDDPQSPISSRFSFMSGSSGGSSDTINEGGIPTSSSVQSSGADNSTAVATVYPDFGGSLSGGNGSLSNGTNTNGTSTAGNRITRVKVACSSLIFGEDEENVTTINERAVEVVNMTYLLHGLLYTNPTIKTRSTPSNCTVVMFITYWCPWSAKAAPHFNALPRAFKNIRFAAIDSSLYPQINTYFGVLSVPSVVLFFNGKVMAKFNETTFSVNHFAEFISTFTDQKAGIRLNVTSQDFIGPIPSLIIKGPDWYLYLSWAFIIACFVYYMSRTAVWHKMLEIFQNSWREAEAVASVPPHHFHQD